MHIGAAMLDVRCSALLGLLLGTVSLYIYFLRKLRNDCGLQQFFVGIKERNITSNSRFKAPFLTKRLFGTLACHSAKGYPQRLFQLPQRITRITKRVKG